VSIPPLGLTHYLIFSALLFCMGLFAVMVRRHAVAILLGVELMLNAANINLVAMSRYLTPMSPAGKPMVNAVLGGQVFALIVMTLAACEVAVGLAIIVTLFRNRDTANPDDAADLKW
jgi:NADH:ubiquinone oxidoreductase subunit K